MVATVSIYFDFGGSDGTPGSSVDVDGLGPPSLRMKLADNATIDTVDKVIIPSVAGTNYSFWKHIYLYCDDPDGKTIDNLKFYSDGENNFGTGYDLQVGLQFPTKNSGSSVGYEKAAGVGDTGEELVANHSGISSKASVFTYNETTPLTGPSISESGNVIDAIGETSNYLLLQMNIANTATEGDLTNEGLTIKYDEY